MSDRPIAVFDSGLGGLSVVRHLRQLLPYESICYFGDTARVPYGSKSRQTVLTFAREAAGFLLRFDPKLIVAACNTVSALALDDLVETLPAPVVGVVTPGAQAAVAAAQSSVIGVIGTEATVASESYVRAIRALAPQAEIVQRACPLLVPLVEEGREPGDAIVQAALDEYLGPLRARGVRALVLGCTHYPLLAPAIATCMGPEVAIVDSGKETSIAVRQLLTQQGALRAGPARAILRFHVSDNPVRFRQVGSRFLCEPIESVEFVEPEQYILHGAAALS